MLTPRSAMEALSDRTPGLMDYPLAKGPEVTTTILLLHQNPATSRLPQLHCLPVSAPRLPSLERRLSLVEQLDSAKGDGRSKAAAAATAVEKAFHIFFALRAQMKSNYLHLSLFFSLSFSPSLSLSLSVAIFSGHLRSEETKLVWLAERERGREREGGREKFLAPLAKFILSTILPHLHSEERAAKK